MDTKAQLQTVRDRLAQLDPNNRDHLVEIANLRTQEAELVKQAVVEEAVEKKDAEIQELVLGHNFNEIFGDPEANKLIHGVMMNLVGKYEQDKAELYREIEGKNKAVIDIQEQLSIKSDEFDRLQTDYESLKAKADELAGAEDRVNGLKRIIEEKDEEIKKLNERIDEELKDSRFHRNQNAQYEMELRKLRTENEELKRNRIMDKDDNTSEVAQRIMQRTNEKRKLANVRTNPDGSITGTDAEGSEVTVPWFAKNSIEAVDTFPEAPMEEGNTSHPALVEVPTFQIPHDAQGMDGVQQPTDEGDHRDGREDTPDVGAQSLEERVKALEDWKQRVEGQLNPASAFKDGAA